jgi:CheY-like chemotaxis protein/nitrogen-specific signal transduction histidine kinase
MSELPSDIADRMVELRRRYLQRLPGRVAEMEAIVDFLTPGIPATQIQCRAASLRELAHNFAGSGAAFGFSELGEHARRLEILCSALIDGTSVLSDHTRFEIRKLIDAVKSESLLPPSSEYAPASPTPHIATSDTVANSLPKQIVVVEDNDEQRKLLDLHLSELGFSVQNLRTTSELEETLISSNVHLVITDIIFDGVEDEGLNTIADLRARGILNCPVIFTTVRSDFEARLGAVRAGCDAYLLKPVDMAELPELVFQITDDGKAEPFRVLVVDDEPETAEYHAALIQGSGLATEVATSSLSVMDRVKEFSPDVVLMDINMPGCSGIELAAIIRQHPAYVQLPIIFATTETTLDDQIKSVTAGGDDLVPKPINAEALIPSILNRAKRWRKLTSIITHMRDATRAAETANQAKSAFLSNMSHELRTPMNSILGFGQLIQNNPKEPLTDNQAECVDQIVKGGRHLLSLINEVLDLAKIESGNISIEIESVSATDIVTEAIELTRSLALGRGIKVVSEILEPQPMIKGDYARLRQVLLNVMSNAIKYNQENGRVTLSSRGATEGFFRVCVTDTGPGIPQDRKDEVFQPFHRLGAENTSVEGTGVGLAITRQLVHLMQGRIGFETTVGEGTTFWIDLPLDESVSTLSEGTMMDLPARTAVAALESSETLTGSVLYVEDNKANLRLMDRILSRTQGLTMLSAPTGEMGVSTAEAERPDVIIMDINLPGMDGFCALEELRRSDITKDIPVIALSANAMPGDMERGRQAGFSRYLSKPVEIEEITSAIATVLSKVTSSS